MKQSLKIVKRSFAVMLCLALILTSMQQPSRAQAANEEQDSTVMELPEGEVTSEVTENPEGEVTSEVTENPEGEVTSEVSETLEVVTETQLEPPLVAAVATSSAIRVDIGTQAAASANGEHSEWGILAANLNNGHTPAASSDPAGSWHDYGIASEDGTSYVQYDWDREAVVEAVSIYWMCDGTWEDRIPKSAVIQYQDAEGSWQTAKTLDESVMQAQAADQYNEITFDAPITTKSLRLTMVRNIDEFCSIHRLLVYGTIEAAPVIGDGTITKINGGYRLSNEYFIVETGEYGQISSLKLQGDSYQTNYVMNAKNASSQNTAGHQWLGELMFAVKVGEETEYTEQTTSRSGSGRTITVDGNKVVITYENATEEKAIKDLKVVETYSLVGEKLHWEITVQNTNEDNLTIGDFGVPLAFNEYWPSGEEIYETRTVDHSFVGKQSSYIYVTRPSGLGNFLLMTPDALTGAGFEYQDHWRVQERSLEESAWCQDQSGWANGLNVFYIHSDYIKNTNRGYLENTKLVLLPGESKTYAFNFSNVTDEEDMKHTLYEEGIVDAVAVPGMAYSVNMPGKLYLHTSLPAEEFRFMIQCPHETGLHQGNQNTVSNLSECTKTLSNTYITYEKTVWLDGEQYHVYEMHFTELGQHNMIITYNGGNSQTVLQFYLMDDVATALDTHADFMVENTQWNTPGQVSDKVFDDWMMDSKNKRGETDSTYWQKNYWGWGDDWGLTHGQFLAEKNVYQPVASQIQAVDDYLDIAIWNGLMREHQTDYLIHDFLMEAPNSSPTYRGYAYPHIYNTYFSMYKIASRYPDMITYTETPDTYLLRAYNILKALYSAGVSYNYSTGLMGEQTTPELITALREEGYVNEANQVTSIMAGKYQNFKDTKYPYGSEYSYDNTGEEAVYTLAKLNVGIDISNAMNMMKKIDLKTRACRGLAPVWYHYANPTTNCGENWWQFQYTASLAGYCMDDWLRLQNNGMDETQLALASRVNYSAKLANLTSINSGQIDADPENIGAVAWTYQSEMGNLGGQGTGGGNLHNGWRQMSGESDLGLFGALCILSSDVVIDPVFGLFGYGCEVSDTGSMYTIHPLDGLYTRLNLINQKLYIELQRDQYTNALIAKDGSSIELTIKNLEQTKHRTDLLVNGLTAGDYDVMINGVLSYQFEAIQGEEAQIVLLLDAAATAQVTITKTSKASHPLILLENDQTITAETKQLITFKPALLCLGVSDAITVNLSCVSKPNDAVIKITELNGNTYQIVADTPGQYELAINVDCSGYAPAFYMTLEVHSEHVQEELLANYTFDAETITGLSKKTAASLTGYEGILLAYNQALAAGKDNEGLLYTGSITGGYAELPRNLTKDLKDATISLDVNLSDTQSNQTALFELGQGVAAEFGNSNELMLSVNGNRVSSGVCFANGFWKNVTVTAANDTYTLYIDGVKKAQLADTVYYLNAIDTNSQRSLIGRSQSEKDPFLKGVIDNIKIYTYALSEETLSTMYGSTEHEIISAQGGSVITTIGKAPVLPKNVRALYSDGIYEQALVTWDAIAPVKYSAPGTFTVTGVITDTAIRVTLKVIVAFGTLQNVAGDAVPSAVIDTPSDLGGVNGLNDGFTPANSRDTSHGAWHNWRGQQGAAAWIRYDWTQKQILTSMDLYFFKDGNGNFAPANYTIEYLTEDGAWSGVTGGTGYGIATNQFNHTEFDAIETTAIRVTMQPAALGCGVIEWIVSGYKEGSVLDKSALNIAIATAQGLNRSLFTAGLENVDLALIAAKEVSANRQANQNEIDQAEFTLNRAICALSPGVSNNIAFMAQVTASYTSSWEKLSAVNDGAISEVSNSYECSHWGTWGNESSSESVTYSWGIPMKISSTAIYLWTDGGGILVPKEYLYEYLDTQGNWQPVANAAGYEILKLRTDNPEEEPNLDGFNITTFDEVITKAIRVTIQKQKADGDGVGLVEWRVFGTTTESIPDAEPTYGPGPMPTTIPANVDQEIEKGAEEELPKTVQEIVTNESGTVTSVILAKIDKAGMLLIVEPEYADKEVKDAMISVMTKQAITKIRERKISELMINLILPESMTASMAKCHVTLPADLLYAAAKQMTNIKLCAVNRDGFLLASFSISGKQLANYKRPLKDIKVSMSIASIKEHEKLSTLTDGIWLHFDQTEVLPVHAAVRVYAGHLTNLRGSRVYLYRYNEVCKRLEEVPYSYCQIDKDGYLSMRLLCGTDYVVLEQKAKDSTKASLLEQITVKQNKMTLLITEDGAGIGSIAVSIPDTMKLIRSLNELRAVRAFGGVMITYATSNEGVALVDENGVIYAVGEGTADITTTITLYNKQTKTVKTKVTVKDMK